MSEAPSLGDFFKAKAKKKIKASNLNKDTTTTKPEEKKTKAKSTEDDQWEEDEVVAATMKVEVAGKLMRAEEKKEDEDVSAPAWGAVKHKETASTLNEKKFPTLAKAVGNTSINIDDGSDPKVNIQTSKNHFAALELHDEEDDDSPKRPKEIKPAMVTKKKGERETVAIQREIKKVTSKDAKKKDETGEGEEEEAEAVAENEEPAPVKEEGRQKKTEDKKDEKKAVKPQQQQPVETSPEELEEDLKIPFDMAASKEKYNGRKKLPPTPLPREELEEEKENRPKPNVGGKKKKFANIEDEDSKPKLQYADW